MKAQGLKDYLTFIQEGLRILEIALDTAGVLPVVVANASSFGDSSGSTTIGLLLVAMEGRTDAYQIQVPTIAQRTNL